MGSGSLYRRFAGKGAGPTKVGGRGFAEQEGGDDGGGKGQDRTFESDVPDTFSVLNSMRSGLGDFGGSERGEGGCQPTETRIASLLLV